MKNIKHKKQHFIPQCYLRWFSVNGKFINVYSKIRKKSYPQAISNTACQENFYKISEKFLSLFNNETFKPNSIEIDFFDKIVERLLGPLLKTINQKADGWRSEKNNLNTLSKLEKEKFAALIAIQYLRMPNIRDKYYLAHKESASAELEIIKSFISNQYPESKEFIDNIEMHDDEDYKPIEHFKIFADQELVDNIQDHILDKIWIFYVSTEKDFYTSDNPIIIKPHLENQPPLYEGFGMKGVEIIFPISSSVLLTLWDKKYFIDREFQDNKFYLINKKEKLHYNCYQYIWANEEIYFIENNFQLVNDLKAANYGDEIFMHRPKILVNGK